MSSADLVTYLTGESSSPLFSKLLQALRESKQGRASAAQWLATLKALTQKGVKTIELEESGALAWLETLEPKQVLPREDVLTEIGRRYYTIKEVVLGQPKYPQYAQPGGTYREYLYIANSERANLEDEVERVEFEMEQLNYDPTPIFEDPGIVTRLEARLKALRSKVDTAIEFASAHFNERIQGKHGKNLLVHVRASVHGDTYFIEEVQSDWAQVGRRKNWQGVPRGPLVTSTEAWAGMVLRRHMQIAAGMPHIKRMAWITESMRNGGPQDLADEEADRAQVAAYNAFVSAHVEQRLAQLNAKDMTPEARQAVTEMAKSEAQTKAEDRGLELPRDLLNDFYLRVLPKLAEKTLGKDGRVTLTSFCLGRQKKERSYTGPVINVPNDVTVPAFEMTPALRQKLAQPQPVYSHAPLALGPYAHPPERIERDAAAALKAARVMLGSTSQVKFAQHVYDVAAGRCVAGAYLDKVVHVALTARDIAQATAHECFHYAHDQFLTEPQRAMVAREFAVGSMLNQRTRDALVKLGQPLAAQQCDDPQEAAAHAFALWKDERLSVSDARPVCGLFRQIAQTVREGLAWLRRTALQERATTVPELFQALNNGLLAQQAARDLDRAQAARASAAAAAAPDPADTNDLNPLAPAGMRPRFAG